MTTENATQTELDKDGFLPTDGPVTDNSPQQPAAQEQPGFEAPKKRRGRPPKNPDVQSESIPKGSATGAGTAKKKAASKTYTASDRVVMGKQLAGMHQMVAMMTGLPELAMSEEEGTMLADAIVNVAEQYDLAIDGKTGAALQLAMTAAMIYGPRALAIRARAQMAKQAAEQNVVAG